MPLTTGTRLHAYEITGAIGAGGMGEVYRAHDARLGRDVAIKVLPASVSADPPSLARFEREARAIGALNHPNVVNIFDTGSDHGISYVVMELLEGETLRARLEGPAAQATPGTGKTPAPRSSSGVRTRGLPRKKALEIAQQIAQGLAAAHARGIVHRDLKPEHQPGHRHAGRAARLSGRKPRARRRSRGVARRPVGRLRRRGRLRSHPDLRPHARFTRAAARAWNRGRAAAGVVAGWPASRVLASGEVEGRRD